MTRDGPTTEGAEARSSHRLLRGQRRCYALGVLREEEPPLTTAELAYEVAHRECGTRTGITDAHVARVQRALETDHLPRLAEAGVVEYDPDRRRVGTNGTLPSVESVVDAVFGPEGTDA